MSATNPTKAELASALAQANAAIAALTAAQAQHATPAPVAETVAVEPLTPGDALKAYVEGEGHLFARGGRTIWTVDNLKALTQVLKTGEPTIVSLKGVGSYEKRGVTGIAIGRNDAKSVLTQFVYDPAQPKG